MCPCLRDANFASFPLRLVARCNPSSLWIAAQAIGEDHGSSFWFKGKLVREILRGDGYGNDRTIFLCIAKGFGFMNIMFIPLKPSSPHSIVLSQASAIEGGGLRSPQPLEALAPQIVLLWHLHVMIIMLTISFVFFSVLCRFYLSRYNFLRPGHSTISTNYNTCIF